MYLVGYGKNVDGVIVPVMTEELEVGTEKYLYYDNGSCGCIVIDGFDEIRLDGVDISDKEVVEGALAAMDVCNKDAALSLVALDGVDQYFLIFDSLDSSVCVKYSPLSSDAPEKSSVDFTYVETEDGDPNLEEYYAELENFE